MSKRTKKQDTIPPLALELPTQAAPTTRSESILAMLARALREAVDATPGATMTDVRTAVASLRRIARAKHRSAENTEAQRSNTGECHA